MTDQRKSEFPDIRLLNPIGSALYEKTYKILIITETFYPEIGGGESQARNLSVALASKGHQVTLLTRRSRDFLPRRDEILKVGIARLPPSGLGQFKKWGMLYSLVPYLLANRRRFDLVLVSGFRIIGIAAAPLCRILRKPCVLKADSMGEMSGAFFGPGLARIGLGSSNTLFRLINGLRHALIRRATCYIAISRAIRAELTSAGIGPAMIRDIPNCVDTDRYFPVSPTRKHGLRQKLDLPAEAPLVIYTGRLVTYKGLFTLLKAWRGLHERHPRAALILVGSGGQDIHNCEDALKDYARRELPAGSVRFTGPVQNVEEYLQASDIFVLPTENEAFGLSLVEAMACGLAVVSTGVDGVADIVENRTTGLTVQARDEVDLQAALDEILCDETLRHRLGKCAHKNVTQRYSIEGVTREYEKLFEELLGV